MKENAINHACNELMGFNQKYTQVSEEDRVFVIKDSVKDSWELFFSYPTDEYQQKQLDSIDIPYCPFCGKDPSITDQVNQEPTRVVKRSLQTNLHYSAYGSQSFETQDW
ncbi:MAG: hypothetical protein ACE3L7_32375 [Candidatus Pristimantibacillus sp.]